MAEMDAEEKAKSDPEESPTAVAAGSIGIKVPPKETSPVDQTTGTLKSLRPKVRPVEGADNTKEAKLKAETAQIIRRRKAEAKAEEINSKIDEKINRVKTDLFQKEEIDAVIEGAKAEDVEADTEIINKISKNQETKRDDNDGESWTTSMPEHWLKQSDEKDNNSGSSTDSSGMSYDTKRDNESSSMIINASNVINKRASGVPTDAGKLVDEARKAD